MLGSFLRYEVKREAMILRVESKAYRSTQMSIWGTFVELHDESGKPFFLNVNKVLIFEAGEEGKGSWLTFDVRDRYRLDTVQRFHCLKVTETPADLARIFQDATTSGP